MGGIHGAAAAAVLLLASAAGASAAGDTVTVRGKVVDGRGKPVAGADVASFWGFDDGPPRPFDGTLTDGKGEFVLEIRSFGRPWGFLAMTGDRTAGAVVTGGPEAPAEPVEARLAPLRRVKGEFTSPTLGRRPPWTNCYVQSPDGKVRLARCMSSKASLDLLLPPGEYRFWAYGTDVKGLTRNVAVAPGKDPVDLGALELEATFLALHYGKALPPWTVTDARGVDRRKAAIADFRGKWLLVEFWGHW